jgi:O-antigen ligase
MVLLLEFSILSFASGGILSRWDILPATDLGPVVETGTGLPATDEAPVVPPSSEALPERLIRKLGSALSGRGYIWIRSLQMAGKTVLLGRGPDTFALYFPNDDPYKSFYGQPDTFIDKPHNMYLQTWLNLGGLAALAFLVMLGLHTYQTIKVLRQSRAVDDRFVLALGLFTGWLAYLVAGFFYDSAVSVAPVFWIIFGLSMAVNRMLLGQTNKN